MIGFSIEFSQRGFLDFKRFSIQRLERAMLVATDRASKDAIKEIRTGFSNAGAARLGGALKQFSDLQKGRVHRSGSEGVSASGGIAIRTRNERTVGAIVSFTEGADIVPVKGRYLWIATDEIPKRAGRRRMTPELYNRIGLDKRIGPLVQVRSVNGLPLLVVKDASVNAAGLPRQAKSRLRGGGLRKGQRAKAFIVAFIGILRTTRTQKVDPLAIVRRHAGRVGELVNNELQKGV